jgi:uncharacterized protein (TIGR02118 family)
LRDGGCATAGLGEHLRHPNLEDAMALLVAMYKKPADPAAFDAYYASTHVPLAKKIPGLRSYDVSAGKVMTPQGESAYHLVALLEFDSADAVAKGLASPDGAAAAGDLRNFAQAGVDMFIFDTRPA